jgi:hypothetical protein
MISAILSNTLGPHVVSNIAKGGIKTIQQLDATGELQVGKPFIYEGHFYSRGFSASNKTNQLSLYEKLPQPFEGITLTLDFSKNGLTNDTAYTRLSGSVAKLFTYAYIAEINSAEITAIPFIIGDLVESSSSSTINANSSISLELYPQDLPHSSAAGANWSPSAKEFQLMRQVPEQVVKELFVELLKEADVPKDWGGEESDLFTSNLLHENRRCTGAFLLKGPSRFHEMTPADCGKRGDQIYRLFNIPSDVYIIQHCHKIGPAVRKYAEALAFQRNFTHKCRYMFIDGYATASLLRANNLWPKA